MIGILNDASRWMIGQGLGLLGVSLSWLHDYRIATFGRRQDRLREELGIVLDTPVLPYGPEIERLICEAAKGLGRKAQFALTSGSTRRPKRMLYTSDRLRSVRWIYLDNFARCFAARTVRRRSVYLFSSLAADESLTSLLLEEERLPPYLATLQAPYRVHSCPAIQELVSQYGSTAVRLWILTIANPGVLYATNPSTLSTFLDSVVDDWSRSKRLVVDFSADPRRFSAQTRRIARRLASGDWRRRLQKVAASSKRMPMWQFAPGVEVYVCWTGGYVTPFLARLEGHLPLDRYQRIPMYAMSTETVQTVTHFGADTVTFLPMAPDVLYEFIADGDADAPENLLHPQELVSGQLYTMVVSDPYGLRRYQSCDLFRCGGFVRGVPELEFERRRGLSYSFTGEKLTSDQVNAVFGQLRDEVVWLGTDDFLACVPSCPRDSSVPRYELFVVGARKTPGKNGSDRDEGDTQRLELAELAARCDALLAKTNLEYHAKREGGRLGPVACRRVSVEGFIHRMGGDQRESWEHQFKFLPLYTRTWEESRT